MPGTRSGYSPSPVVSPAEALQQLNSGEVSFVHPSWTKIPEVAVLPAVLPSAPLVLRGPATPIKLPTDFAAFVEGERSIADFLNCNYLREPIRPFDPFFFGSEGCFLSLDGVQENHPYAATKVNMLQYCFPFILYVPIIISFSFIISQNTINTQNCCVV